jgi:L-alanine-DL-glutamate epimerase-like enolase superfamily enzyme
MIDLSAIAGNHIGNLVNFEALGKEIARPPLLQQGGYVPLPTTPGLGIDLDEDALRAHAYKPFPDRRIRQPADEP